MVAASCLGGDGRSPTEPLTPAGRWQFVISDGSRPDGTAGFYFLPPMVSHPSFNGTFDYDIGAITPVVAICDITVAPDVACGSSAPNATPAIRTFTMSSQPPVTVDFEKYKVNWDTGEDGFVAGRVYRIHVFAGPARRELGFADVALTQTPGQLKNSKGDLIVLKDGRTLPIHFRIEAGVVPRVGPARSLQLTGLPATVPAGTAAPVTVTALDEHGNVAAGYRGTIVFSTSSSSATLPAEYTFTEADAGIHTFANAVSFLTAGPATVHAADRDDETIAGEAPLTVEPLAASRFQLTGLTDPSEAGAVSSVTVTARDVHGNVASGYRGTIAFTSNDPHATLPENHTFTAEDAGIHAFPASVTLRTAGTRTVRAMDNADETLFGEMPITVLASGAATLDVAGIANPADAGVAGSITVTARDASGNVATSYVGTIVFTSTDAQATLPASYTFTADDAGTRTFPASVTLRTAGDVTVTAADEATPAVTGGRTVTVRAAAAATLELVGVPPQSTAGSAHALTVTARDPFGNVATGYTGTVQFSSTDPAATVPGPYAFQPVDAGTRAFPAGVTFRTAGTHTLTVVDPAAPALTASGVSLVAAGPAERLRFTVQPSDVIAESVISPAVVVTAYDGFDNQAASYTGPVGVAIGTNPAGAVLSGSLQVGAVAGVATFAALALDRAGTGYTLVASAAGLTSATSDPFNVIAPTPVEVHWINGAGGNWSVGGNWNTGAPPTSEQTAFIDLPGTYTVVLDVNASVTNLSLGASSGVQTLTTVTSRTLGFLTSAQVLGTGRLILNGATFTGGGPLAIATGGVLTFVANGTLNTSVVNAGTLVAGLNQFSASATISGSVTNMAGAMLRVQAGGSNSSALTVGNGISNQGAIELTKTLDAIGGSTLAVSGTLLNAVEGTITSAVGSGGGRSLVAQLENHGTVTVLQPLSISRAGAVQLNRGTIAVSGGNLSVSQSAGGSFTNAGTITVASGLSLAVGGGGFTLAAGAALSGAGSLSLSGVNPATFSGAFTIASLGLASTIASFATDFSTAVTSLSMINSTFNGPGTLTNDAGETLSLSLTNTINTALHNAGTLASGVPPSVSTNTVTGAFTTAATSLVRVTAGGSNSATLTFASGFTNNGTIELTKVNDASGAATLGVTNGTLVNAAGATLRSALGSGGGRTLAAQLDNRGTVSVLHGLVVNRVGAAHLNAGSIAVSGGNLTVTQTATGSFTNSGIIDVDAARTVTVSGGSLTHAAGATLGGAGSLSLSGVSPAVFGGALAVGALGLTSTIASFAADLSTATTSLSMVNSTFNGPGTLTNDAGETLTLSQTNSITAPLVNAGTLLSGVPPFVSSNTISGAFSNVAGSLTRVHAGGSNSATLTIAQGFTNHGTIELTKANDAIGAAFFNVTNGTLVNASDGTIRSAVGTGGGRTLNAQLDNQGTLSVLHPLTVNRVGAAHLNSGTMSITGGDLTLTQSGTTPSFTNSGTIDVATARALRIGTGAITNAAGAFIQGLGIFEAGTLASFTNAGTVNIALARIGDGFTSTGAFQPGTAEFFAATATIPVGAGYAYNHVRVLGAATFGGSTTIGGNLTVVGTGNLTIGAHEIGVAGDFATQNTAVLTMQNAAGVLSVAGNVTFGGGSTNTRLTAGALRLAGNFTQTGNAAAFAASGGHVTVLNGTGAQGVAFTNPGSGTTLSHFHRLEMANASAAGVTLSSAAFATGQLRTATGLTVARTMISAGLTLQVAGLDVDGLMCDGLPLRVVNGEALTRFDNVVFRNMAATATQLRLDRQGDVVTFNNVAFLTPPTSGFYLHLVDTDLVAPLFTVTMLGTQPPNHGGRVIESVAGQLQGWSP